MLYEPVVSERCPSCFVSRSVETYVTSGKLEMVESNDARVSTTPVIEVFKSVSYRRLFFEEILEGLAEATRIKLNDNLNG